MKLSPSREAIPSYQARFQMQWDSKILLICPSSREATPHIWPLPTKAIPSYQARFQMHGDSKILLICPIQERPLLLKGYFFIAEEVALLSGITVNSYVFVNLSLETKLCWNGLCMIPYQSITLCLHIYPKWFLLLKIENSQKYRPFSTF